MRKRFVLTVVFMTITGSIICGVIWYRRFATNMERRGRLQTLNYIMLSALSARPDLNEWPNSFNEFKANLNETPKGTLAFDANGAHGIEIFSFAGGTYAYGGGRQHAKSGSSGITILIVELTPSRDDTVGLVTSDGEIHFIPRTELPAFSASLERKKSRL